MRMNFLWRPGALGLLITYDGVAFDAEGNFEIDMGYVMVSGEANPISGFDIEAQLNVIGHIVHPDAMCGELEGMVVNPLIYDLAGSTFGAIRLDNDGCAAGTLPTTVEPRGLVVKAQSRVATAFPSAFDSAPSNTLASV